MTLDLGHDRLWLKPIGGVPVFNKDRVGMFVMLEDDHFNVLHVTPGSPADRAGLKKGDKLIEIGGERVGPGFYTSKRAGWAREAIGTKVGITKIRGSWKLYRGKIPVMPTYHPSYLLRPSPQQSEAKRQAWEDLQAVMKELGLSKPPRT